MICKNCSADIPEDGLFCPICGVRTDGNKPCPNCQKLIPEQSMFCAYCGTKVVNNEPTCHVSTTKEQPQRVDITPVITPTTTNDDDPTNDAQNADSNDETLVQCIVCSQCGSNDVELITETLGKCNNCNSQIIINTPKDNNYVTNNVTINMKGDGLEETIGFFELPKEIDDKTFFANALTDIALDKNSPEDIFTSGKFEPVKTEYRQYVLAKGTAQMTYSATVGYDRKETYYEKERRWDSNKREYTYEDVKKTRTVTDWEPFSGNYTGEYIEATPNDNNSDVFDAFDYKQFCSATAQEYDVTSSKSPAPMAPSSTSINNVKSGIKELATADCKSNLPGDRNKDFKCNGTVSLNIVQSHVAPQYVLKYKYSDADYTLKAHSAKKSVIRGDKPSAKSEIQSEIESTKIVKTFNIITLCTLLASIICSILLPIAFKIVIGAIGVVSFITYWILRSKTSKKVYLAKSTKKKNDLTSLLKNKGIAIPKQLNEEAQ